MIGKRVSAASGPVILLVATTLAGATKMWRQESWHPSLVLAAMAMLGVAASGFAQAMTPPAMAPPAQRADRIHVDKSERRMELLRDGKVLRRYHIRLGDAPVGHKRQQGDERTPEGDYRISGRNPDSRFHLSLRVSYPNAADRRQARARGVDPGGDIMIHGGSSALYPFDWTDGCIAVTGKQIEGIWSLVPTGTPIRIDP